MFSLRENITSSIRPRLANVHARLPQAHRRAALAGTNHLHEYATKAAEEAGFSADAVVVHWRKGAPHVAIDNTPDGDALADHEFGRPGQAPNPVLRTVLSSAHPSASEIYHRTLRRELGL